MTRTHYKRPLPDTAIAFASREGRQLFAEAMEGGGLERYFPLAEQFHTQSEPAYCGLGSLVMALNALDIDPERQWPFAEKAHHKTDRGDHQEKQDTHDHRVHHL